MTNGSVNFAQSRAGLAAMELAAVKPGQIVTKKVIEPAITVWAAPIVFAHKKDSSLYVGVDSLDWTTQGLATRVTSFARTYVPTAWKKCQGFLHCTLIRGPCKYKSTTVIATRRHSHPPWATQSHRNAVSAKNLRCMKEIEACDTFLCALVVRAVLCRWHYRLFDRTPRTRQP